MARVTVVTAAFNAADYIEATIESVLAQTYADFEYIVVDDGSTDATPEIIARYGARVSSIRQSNAGEGAARNRAFEVAAGDYVAIVDADDVWAPEKLSRQVAAMDADPRAGLCYTNGRMLSGDGTVLKSMMVPRHRPLTCLTALTGHNPIVTSSVMYRRRFLERRPYGSLPIAADFHVHLKVLWRAGEHSVFLDEPLFGYRFMDSSVTRKVDPSERGRHTLEAVEDFIAEMERERPVTPEVRRRGTAYAYYQWAWYCIDACQHRGFAARKLCAAAAMDWRLIPTVSRQFAKMALTWTGGS